MNDNDKQQQPGNGPENGGGNPWMKSLLVWVGILLALALFVLGMADQFMHLRARGLSHQEEE